MSQSNHVKSDNGVVLGLLGVAFVVLKLTHVISWSWWWVLLPFYGGAVVVLLIVAVVLLLGVLS